MKPIKLLALIIAVLVSPMAKSQQIAYIYRDSIIAATPHYMEKLQKTDSLQKEYSQEIKGLREQLQLNLNKLVSKYNPKQTESLEGLKKMLSPQDTIRLNLLLDEDQMLTKREKSYNELLKQNYQKNVQPIIDKVNTVIEEYAKKNNIDLVIILEEQSRGIAYINRSKNITKKLIEIIKKQ